MLKTAASGVKKRWRVGGALFGLLLMAIGQWQIFRDPPIEWLNGGYLLMLSGLASFFIASREVEVYPAVAPLPVPAEPAIFHIHRVWLALSIALFSVVTLRSITSPPVAYLGEYLLLWGLAILALLLAVRQLKTASTTNAESSRLNPAEYYLVIGLLLMSLLIRGTNLESVPALLDQDEATFAQQGAYSRAANHFLVNPFAPGFHSYALLHSSLIGLSSGIFGETLFGARLPSVILGSLGILAIYLLGRELYNWQVGLVAAAFALTWPFQIIFSRLALNQPGDPLFVTLAFYFLLRGLRRVSPIDYALSGIMLGVAQFFYLGGRLGILIIATYLVLLWIQQRTLVRRQWRLIALLALAAFLVTLPQNIYQVYFQLPITSHTDPSIFSGPFQQAAEKGANALREYLTQQATAAFGGLFALTDRAGWYGSGSNLMGPFGGFFLCIGALVLVLKWRRHSLGLLPLIWASAVLLLGVALTLYPPYYQRYFPGVSALALLVGVGVVASLKAITQGVQWRLSRIVIGVAILLLLANGIFYYGLFVPGAHYIDNRNNHIVNQVAQAALDAFNNGKRVFILAEVKTPIDNSNVLKYFMIGKDYTVLYTPTEDKAYQAIDRAGSYLIIIAPERVAEVDTLFRLLPGGAPSIAVLPGENHPIYYTYEH